MPVTSREGRQFIHTHFVQLAVLADACLVAIQAPAQQVASSPYREVEPVPLTEVQWTDGFWKQRLDTCRDKTVPAMWEIMQGTKHKPYLEHFRIAAGLVEGNYRGAPFNDGDFYKWMEAVCALQASEPDTDWDMRLDEIIEIIGKAQRSDGYLHTPVLIANRNGDTSVKPFGDRFNFEMYNMGHLMTAACLHHAVTGKDSLLTIARKAADFLDEAYRSPTPEQAGHAICPSHYMGLLALYRATGETRYLNLVQRLIQMRDSIVDGGDDNQDRIPFTRQTEAVGHAVRATYLYAGIADLYAETGDQKLQSSLDAIWKNVAQKKMYITGGCGALYDGASPDGSKDQGAITRIHQAFGRNYQLPNTTAHNETCANIGNVLWNWRMFLASGEAKYVDVMELALYNSVLSGVGLHGTDFFYTNPLRQSDVAPVELKLRIPGWATSATINVDGEPIATKLTPGTYVSLERTWRLGTVIELNLEMPPQLIESHPLVEETRDQLAVKRGPIVYCLESVDLPEGISLADVRVPVDVKLQPRFDANLLDGVMLLEGTFVSRRAGDWQERLYREFKRSEATPIAAKLIPYYAWSNRGTSEMSVWIPLN